MSERSRWPTTWSGRSWSATQVHDHRWQDVDTAISDATDTIHGALRVGAWTRAGGSAHARSSRHPATGRARA